MSELFSQLGIDFKLLIAQGVNFLILLLVLTKFVYRPLIKLIEKRREKIELGIKGGEMAAQVIKDAEERGRQGIKEADLRAVVIISEAEKNAQKKAQEIAHQADKKAQKTLQEALLIAERKEKEEMEKVSIGAKKLVKDILVKTVELEPSQVDERLIDQALKMMAK